MTSENMKDFEPQFGLIVYHRQQHYYLQVHEIRKNENGYSWGEGKPFQKEQLHELATSLKKENLNTLQLQGLLPENVLYYQPAIGGSKFAWWVPPGEHFINFNEVLKLKSGKCQLPGLIFAADGNDMIVIAYKGKDKPTAKTLLFNGPFYNVYNDGRVCLGTTSETRKKAFLNEEMDRWQRRFFGSRFTNAHGDNDKLVKGFKLKDLYKALLSGKPFPEKALKEFEHKTLELFIKDLAR